MGQFSTKFREMSGRNAAGAGEVGNSNNPNYDPDEKWSNLYREREKNHLYKWVGTRAGKQTFDEVSAFPTPLTNNFRW